MVSHSKSSANIALCFAAMLMACTTQAQLSTLPKRYRSENRKVQQKSHLEDLSDGSFGRRASQNRQTESSNTEATKTNLRKKTRKLSTEELSLSLSFPFDARRFDISLSAPSIEEFDFSMSIDQAALDMSLDMSMSMSMPSLEDIPKETEVISIGNESEDSGDKVVLGSFMAGIAALVLLGAAFLVKKVRSRRSEESQEVDPIEGPPQQVHLSTDLA